VQHLDAEYLSTTARKATDTVMILSFGMTQLRIKPAYQFLTL